MYLYPQPWEDDGWEQALRHHLHQLVTRWILAELMAYLSCLARVDATFQCSICIVQARHTAVSEFGQPFWEVQLDFATPPLADLRGLSSSMWCDTRWCTVDTPDRLTLEGSLLSCVARVSKIGQPRRVALHAGL